jgi:hypothetical protein
MGKEKKRRKKEEEGQGKRLQEVIHTHLFGRMVAWPRSFPSLK